MYRKNENSNDNWFVTSGSSKKKKKKIHTPLANTRRGIAFCFIVAVVVVVFFSLFFFFFFLFCFDLFLIFPKIEPKLVQI